MLIRFSKASHISSQNKQKLALLHIGRNVVVNSDTKNTHLWQYLLRHQLIDINMHGVGYWCDSGIPQQGWAYAAVPIVSYPQALLSCSSTDVKFLKLCQAPGPAANKEK